MIDRKHTGKLTAELAFDCLALLTVAAILRFWNFPRLGLTHFDEGTYTMAGKWLATFGREGWPLQANQSPAGFPMLLGLMFRVFGTSDTVAISVSAVAGSLTVVVIYLAGRSWFSRSAGIWAAIFLATAQYHLIYSRMALTDVTFTLLFWMAVASYFQAFQVSGGRQWPWLMVGGLSTGLCWNIKYHGGFPLIVFFAWMILCRITDSRLDAHCRSRMTNRKLMLAGALSIGLIFPWMIVVGFTVGLRPIWETLFSHSLFSSQVSATKLSTLLFYLQSWLSPPFLLAAIAGLLHGALKRGGADLFIALVFLLFSLSTLLYMPFPRLLLPVVPALCLLAASGTEGLSRLFSQKFPVLLMGGVIVGWNLWQSVPLLDLATDSYRRAASYIQEMERPVVSQLSKNYYFYEGQPSRELRFQELDQAANFMNMNAPVVVVVDPIILRLPVIEEWIAEHESRLRLLREFNIQMYEPGYYQGFNPEQGLNTVPLSQAPFRPGESRIRIYIYR